MERSSFEVIRRLVQQESAIVLREGKEYLVEARLGPLCQQEGFPSIEALVNALKTRRRVLSAKIVEALTTNETSFFRDIHPFDTMRESVLPELIEARKSVRALDIWCGASSSGQEPVSLGIMIREHFPELADWRIRIVSTDISKEMVARCQSGLYSQLEVARGLPAKLQAKYFRKEGTRWRVNDDVMRILEYKQMNLAAPFPVMPPKDVIFLRNVLIYFEPRVRTKILQNVHRILKPDGTLFLGTAESTLGLCDGFSPCSYDSTTCYRRAG